MSSEAHEKGIEAAADEYDSCWHDSYDDELADNQAAERIIQAYLSASGMALVPLKSSKEGKLSSAAFPCDRRNFWWWK